MSTIPPVDRVGGVIPVSRRDHAHSPAAGEGRDGRDQPAGKDTHDGRRDPPPAAEVPANAPLSPLGRIVNTFARSGISSSRSPFLTNATLRSPCQSPTL